MAPTGHNATISITMSTMIRFEADDNPEQTLT